MKFKSWFAAIYILLVVNTTAFAQNGNLKRVSDDNWIEYLVPRFMNDVTPYGDNFSPHFTRYDFESRDKKVKIYVLLNNSVNISPMMDFTFKINERYLADINDKDLMVDYKLLKQDKYFVSGNLKNGNILYKFCYVKTGYGYTYSIEYDRSYKVFFDKNLNDIIKGFKILWGVTQYK